VASRRRNRAPAVSLFPFLSVLACVIGTLTLLIAAIALGQMGSDEFLERWQELQQSITSDSLAADGARANLANANALVEELSSAREVLEALGVKADATRDEQRRIADRAARASALQQQRYALETELANLRSAIVSEEATLAELAAARDDDQPIVLKPAGTGRGLRPYFVECRFDELVVYDAGNEPDMTVRRAFIEHSWDFRRFLGEVRDDRTATVIFLIRPDGIDVYERAQRAATGVRVRHGKIPLPGNGVLDFSEFEKSARKEPGERG